MRAVRSPARGRAHGPAGFRLQPGEVSDGRLQQATAHPCVSCFVDDARTAPPLRKATAQETARRSCIGIGCHHRKVTQHHANGFPGIAVGFLQNRIDLIVGNGKRVRFRRAGSLDWCHRSCPRLEEHKENNQGSESSARHPQCLLRCVQSVPGRLARATRFLSTLQGPRRSPGRAQFLDRGLPPSAQMGLGRGRTPRRPGLDQFLMGWTSP